MGTTSAYAENTQTLLQGGHTGRNYLRVRGEYTREGVLVVLSAELPPRTRRIPCPSPTRREPPRTTSAYAENTLNELGLL